MEGPMQGKIYEVCASPYLGDVSTSSQDSGILFFHVGLVLADDLELESHQFSLPATAAAITAHDNEILK